MEELTKNPLAIWWSMVSVKLIQRPAQNNKESTYIQAMQAPNLQELLKTFWIRQGSTFLSEKGRILRQVSWSFRYFECLVILSNMFCLYCNRYRWPLVRVTEVPAMAQAISRSCKDTRLSGPSSSRTNAKPCNSWPTARWNAQGVLDKYNQIKWRI